MLGGLDLFRLYSASGPALIGILIVVAGLAWKDSRRLFQEVKAEASDASATAEEAKERAATAVKETNRHEILLDSIATDVEELGDATAQNDRRITRVRERQAAKWGADFQRGGAAADADRRADRDSDTIDAGAPDPDQNQTANAPREDS